MTNKEVYDIITKLNVVLGRCNSKIHVSETLLHCENALIKQIPKKPDRGSEMYCADCGTIVETTENYCWYCGQAIDWTFLQEGK